MASVPSPAVAVVPPAAAAIPSEITVVSHSNLFYWWPVWAVGFVMALITYIDGNLLVVTPPGSKRATFSASDTTKPNYLDPYKAEVAEINKIHPVKGKDGTEKYYVVVAKETDKSIEAREAAKQVMEDPKLHISRKKSLGVIFCVVLLLVVVITNVPLRGLWSVIVIGLIIALSIIFALAGWWDTIFAQISALDIRINMGGYLTISIALFTAWLITLLFFDRQVYMVFQPGQFKVCTEIGGGEKVYDTMGLTMERQRSDIFRHLLIGLGSGDLIVRTTGAQAHQFDLPNVLFISSKVAKIEDLLRRHKTTPGGS